MRESLEDRGFPEADGGRERRASGPPFRQALVLVLGALALAAVTAAPVAADYSVDTSDSVTRPAGQPSGEARTRVIGGSGTNASAFPWQVALVLDSRFAGNDYERQFCGGSLITPYIVVTAAHCLFDTDPDCADPPRPCGSDPGGDGSLALDDTDVDVVVGRTTLSGTGGAEESVYINGVYINGAYDPSTARGDLGYLTLANPITAQARIDIVDRNNLRAWRAGAPTRVTGYGLTETAVGANKSDTLQLATVPIIADAGCANPFVYGSFFFRRVQICAGFFEGGIDSCQGDSGGPLQTAAGAASGATRLVGVVSFGSGCAEQNKPGVYTRLAQNPFCEAVIANVDQIEQAEGVPPAGQEAVVGPAGCSDKQFTLKKRCKKKKSSAAAVRKKRCGRKKKGRKRR